MARLFIGGHDRSADYEGHNTANLPGQSESAAVYMRNVHGVRLNDAALLIDADGRAIQGHVESVIDGWQVRGVSIREEWEGEAGL